MNYRDRIYVNYASNFQDAGETFDEHASQRWGMSYGYYLRGWLPVSKDANIAEVACGGGRLLNFFKRKGYDRLWGVDLSPQQVKLARQARRGLRRKTRTSAQESRTACRRSPTLNAKQLAPAPTATSSDPEGSPNGQMLVALRDGMPLNSGRNAAQMRRQFKCFGALATLTG